MLEHRSRRGADAAGNGDEEDGEEDGGEAARRAAARVKSQAKTQSLNVSMRAPGEAGSSGGGAPVGSGGADGARGLKAPLEGREALMAAEREAESERWVDLEWKNEDVRTDKIGELRLWCAKHRHRAEMAEADHTTDASNTLSLPLPPRHRRASPRKPLMLRCLRPQRRAWSAKPDRANFYNCSRKCLSCQSSTLFTSIARNTASSYIQCHFVKKHLRWPPPLSFWSTSCPTLACSQGPSST